MSATVHTMSDLDTPDYHTFAVPLPTAKYKSEPVGVQEASARIGVKPRSMHMMHRRGRLPRPDYEAVNGSAAWEWRTLLWWAGETNRLRTPDLVEEYRKMFGTTELDRIQRRSPDGVVNRVDLNPGIPLVPS